MAEMNQASILQVLRDSGEGMTAREIADNFSVSPRSKYCCTNYMTVKARNHLHKLEHQGYVVKTKELTGVYWRAIL